jgi:hypothetical protein
MAATRIFLRVRSLTLAPGVVYDPGQGNRSPRRFDLDMVNYAHPVFLGPFLSIHGHL